MRRKLGSCCECLKAIYYYPALTVDKEFLWCAECTQKDMPDAYTSEQFAAKQAEERGPFHARLEKSQQHKELS